MTDMYFHTDDPSTLFWLKNVLQKAVVEELPVRLSVGGDGSLKVKVGGGMWTAPIRSTFDLSRDASVEARLPDTDCGNHPPQDVCPGYEGDENDPDVLASCKQR